MNNLKDILQETGFTFSKRYGQNFLTDGNLLKAIVKDAGVTDRDTVLEIGPGAGALTRALSDSAHKVVAYEIDKALQPVLQRTLAGLYNTEVVFTDIMQASEEDVYNRVGRDYLLVANLPYYITTPILFRFTECQYPPRTITVMVQKEVADRLTADAGSADYGAITASVALTYKAQTARVVSRKLFTPEPNVDSAVVCLQYAPQCDNPADVRRLIKAAFGMRRKTLANNLSSVGIPRARTEAALQRLGLPPAARGETLSAAQFIRLHDLLQA